MARFLVAGLLVALTAVLGLAGAGIARADGAIELPLRVDSTIGLDEQFGYYPEYDRNVPTFDSRNVPYIRSRTSDQDDTSHVDTLGAEGWVELDLLAALAARYPDMVGTHGAGGYASDRVILDSSDRAYTALTVELTGGRFRNVLMYSLDRCLSWQVCQLPLGGPRPYRDGRDIGNLACETFTGHNLRDGPPFVAVWRETADWAGPWATRNTLFVTQPYFNGTELVAPRAVAVTTRFLGMVQSAGGSSFAATAGDRTWFVWAEVAARAHDGAPVFVAAYRALTGTVSKPRLLCRAQPGNDAHVSPAICLDGRGYLHVVTGAHGRPFLYTRSREPLSSASWTCPSRVLTSGCRDATSDADGWGKQTYPSLVCDQNDVLHLVSRQKRQNVDAIFGGERYAALVSQRKAVGERWTRPRLLVVCTDGPGYTNYYQKLGIDRLGRLFLSLSIWRMNGPVATRCERRFRCRMVLVSDDASRWRFATTADFAAGITGT
jgi:hypothetical protein